MPRARTRRRRCPIAPGTSRVARSTAAVSAQGPPGACRIRGAPRCTRWTGRPEKSCGRAAARSNRGITSAVSPLRMAGPTSQPSTACSIASESPGRRRVVMRADIERVELDGARAVERIAKERQRATSTFTRTDGQPECVASAFRRKSAIRALLLTLTSAAAGTIAFAQPGRGGSQWLTALADAQRTSWVRTDDKISVTALGKPGFELQWKVKLDNQPRGPHGLAQGVTASGVTLFVPMSIVTGSSNNVYAIDNDIGYVV